MMKSNGTAERRAAVRIPCQASTCRLLDNTPQQARIRDVSASGVGLVCEAPLQPGTLLALALSGPNKRLSVAVQARVVRAEPEPDGGWVAGCAFTRKLPEGVLALLR